MTSFTDVLNILNKGIVENNYLDLTIKPSELIWQANNRWKYFADGWLYPNKLSEYDWNEAKNAFIEAGQDVKINQKAEIIKNLKDNYVVWLCFTDKNGCYRKIDVPVWKKNFYGKSNGKRKIDIKCPKVDDIRNAIINSTITTEDILILDDILASRPEFDDVNTLEKKLQYKLNGSVIESVFKYITKQNSIPCQELDEFGKYIYKGSPGDIADFDIILDTIKYRIDTKLIKTSNTSVVKSLAHDADILISYSLTDKKIIVDVINEQKKDVIETQKFKKLINDLEIQINNLKTPFINIHNINKLTGEIEYSLFKGE